MTIRMCVVFSREMNASSDVTMLPNCDQAGAFMRAKLLQFHENYRPAYYGTWRKSSTIISARRPWQRDTSLFDYEVDSDEEWEEEEPGESLSHSEVLYRKSVHNFGALMNKTMSLLLCVLCCSSSSYFSITASTDEETYLGMIEAHIVLSCLRVTEMVVIARIFHSYHSISSFIMKCFG